MSEWDGYITIQSGHVIISAEEATAREQAGEPKFSFADRVRGCDISLIRSGDVLMENKGEWIHMRAVEEKL